MLLVMRCLCLKGYVGQCCLEYAAWRTDFSQSSCAGHLVFSYSFVVLGTSSLQRLLTKVSSRFKGSSMPLKDSAGDNLSLQTHSLAFTHYRLLGDCPPRKSDISPSARKQHVYVQVIKSSSGCSNYDSSRGWRCMNESTNYQTFTQEIAVCFPFSTTSQHVTTHIILLSHGCYCKHDDALLTLKESYF